MTERIQKQAEALYPLHMIGGGIDSKTVRQLQQNAYVKGAESESERYKEVVECLEEAMELIEYMHQMTALPDNMQEDYANRYMNTMHRLSELKSALNKLNENQ